MRQVGGQGCSPRTLFADGRQLDLIVGGESMCH